MFDRQELKRQAKAQLRGHWTTPVLITLVTGIVLAIVTVPQMLYSIYQEVYGYGDEISFASLTLFPITVLAVGVFEIAAARYYLIFTARQDNAPF